MALNKTIRNERKEDVSYWKIRNYRPDTIDNMTEVTLYGFISHEDRIDFLTMPKAVRKYTFDGILQTFAEVYDAIKQSTEFIDAIDC